MAEEHNLELWSKERETLRGVINHCIKDVFVQDNSEEQQIVDWTLGSINGWFCVVDDQDESIGISGLEENYDILKLYVFGESVAETRPKGTKLPWLYAQKWMSLRPHLPFGEMRVTSVEILFGEIESETTLDPEMQDYKQRYKQTQPLEAVIFNFADGQSLAFVNSYVRPPTTVDMFYDQDMIKKLYADYLYRVNVT